MHGIEHQEAGGPYAAACLPHNTCVAIRAPSTNDFNFARMQTHRLIPTICWPTSAAKPLANFRHGSKCDQAAYPRRVRSSLNIRHWTVLVAAVREQAQSPARRDPRQGSFSS